MESPIMIVMLALIGLVMGGTNEMFLEIKEKMVELNDRVMIAEQKLLDTKKLEKEILKLRDAPYLHQCGYSLDAGQGSKFTITFDNLFYSSTNTEGGGLDLETGVFTAPYPGTYTITYSLSAQNNNNDPYMMIVPLHGDHEMSGQMHSTNLITQNPSSIADQGILAIIFLIFHLSHLSSFSYIIFITYHLSHISSFSRTIFLLYHLSPISSFS